MQEVDMDACAGVSDGTIIVCLQTLAVREMLYMKSSTAARACTTCGKVSQAQLLLQDPEGQDDGALQ